MRALPIVIVAAAVLAAGAATVVLSQRRDAQLADARERVAGELPSKVDGLFAGHQRTLVGDAKSLALGQLLQDAITTDANTVKDLLTDTLKNVGEHPVYVIGRGAKQPQMPDEIFVKNGLDGMSDDDVARLPAVRAALDKSSAEAGIVETKEHIVLAGVAPVASRDGAVHGFVLQGDIIDEAALSTMEHDEHAALALSDGRRTVVGKAAGKLSSRLQAAVGHESEFEDHTFTDADSTIAARAVALDPAKTVFVWVAKDIAAEKVLIESSYRVEVSLICGVLLGGGLIVAFVLWRRGRPAPESRPPAESWATTGTTPPAMTTPPRAGTTGTGPAATVTTEGGAPPSVVTPEGVTNMFGRYLLLERLGAGGMAEVWTAVATGAEGFRRPVVVKRIRRDLAANQALIQPFIDEANLAAQLVHPNIVPVFDFGHLNGEYFLAQEYILGRDVAKITQALGKRGERLDPGLTLYICAETLKALDYAHTLTDRGGRPLGIVHRDISPANILCSLRGDVKLIDFGIAKSVSKVGQTEFGTVKGNLRFMSPEQAQGAAVDGRSDVFSLAMSAYFTQSGESLYTGATQYDLLFAAAHGPGDGGFAKVNALREPLREFVVRALATSRDDRFPSAQACLEMMQPLVPVDGARRLAALLNDLFGAELHEQERVFAGEGEVVDTSTPATVQAVSPRVRQGIS